MIESLSKRTFVARAASVVLSSLLAFSGAPVRALAGYAEKPLVAQAALPQKYDLRDEGLVTPVKDQHPWGSCWAFGGIAAAETSILSRLGMTYAQFPLDLSETHLTWYGEMAISEAASPSQAGEGMYMVQADANPFDVGGNNYMISTVFSAGIGPMLEQSFPYRGNAGILESDYYQGHRDEIVKESAQQLVDAGYDPDEATAYAQRLVDEKIERIVKCDYYSSFDDWAIPETDEEGESNRNRFDGFTLRDDNKLTEPNVRDDQLIWTGLSDEGMKAMKSEILAGNGVVVNYAADTSRPGTVENGYSINLDTWSQYTFDDAIPNHCVCVVGWDDTYPASKFTHDVYVVPDGEDAANLREEAKAVHDLELSKLTTPPGDGAWIVKNSWGSETDAVRDGLVDAKGRTKPQNLGKWGIKNAKGEHTGYFYLSYYDRSIFYPETYEFDIDFSEADSVYSNVYDYMPGIAGTWTLKSKSVISTANEFVAEGKQRIDSVSTRTADENSRVDFKIYKLAPDTSKPENGELVAQFSKTFPYAGFHRIDVPVSVIMDKGQKFSVVSTCSEVNEKGQRIYNAAAAQSIDKAEAEEHEMPLYSVAVVNPGESFLRIGDNWVDWSHYQKGDEFKASARYTDPIYGEFDTIVDNFAIKAFAVPVA